MVIEPELRPTRIDSSRTLQEALSLAARRAPRSYSAFLEDVQRILFKTLGRKMPFYQPFQLGIVVPPGRLHLMQMSFPTPLPLIYSGFIQNTATAERRAGELVPP